MRKTWAQATLIATSLLASTPGEAARITEIPLARTDTVLAESFGLPSSNRRNSEYYVLRAYVTKTDVRTIDVRVRDVPQGARFFLEDGSLKWRKDPTDPGTLLLTEAQLQAAGIPADVPKFSLHMGLDFQSRPAGGGQKPVPLPFHAGFSGRVKLYPGSSTNTIGVVPDANPNVEVQFLHAGQVLVQDGQSVWPFTKLGQTGNKGGGAIHLHVQVLDAKRPSLKLDPDEVLPALFADTGQNRAYPVQSFVGEWIGPNGKVHAISGGRGSYQVQMNDTKVWTFEGTAQQVSSTWVPGTNAIKAMWPGIPDKAAQQATGQVRIKVDLVLRGDTLERIHHRTMIKWDPISGKMLDVSASDQTFRETWRRKL
jgi:hypothetical protein